MSGIVPRMASVGRRCRIPSKLSYTTAAATTARSAIATTTLQSRLSTTRKVPIHAAIGTATPVCYYSSSPLLSAADDDDGKAKKEFAKLPRLEDANPERIHGIEVNPDSLGHGVLPGNLIYKTYKWSGNTRKIPLELAHGYFWMVRDLKKTNQKPTLSNMKLIPEKDAQVFPTLEGLTTLDDLDTPVDLPLVFLEHAHGMQKSAKASKKQGGGKISLVAITFRDNGFKMIPTWTEPFEQAFGIDETTTSSSSSSKVQSFTISITERWALYPIRNTVKRVMKKNTPASKHSTTLAYFGTKEAMDFRDVLRMHNIMTSYVFLLDDLGRVRFAGSGEATPEEVENLVGFAKELVRESEGTKSKRSKNRR